MKKDWKNESTRHLINVLYEPNSKQKQQQTN